MREVFHKLLHFSNQEFLLLTYVLSLGEGIAADD